MASNYVDLMRPTVEQFAYLKCPSKIRAAVINAGGKRISADAISRKLATMTSRVEGGAVGEPTESDGNDYRVASLVPQRKQPTVQELIADRRRIAALAALIPDREPPAKAEKLPPERPRVNQTMPDAAVVLIERVCAELGISEGRFFASRKHGMTFAARSLVAVLLRERNPQAYSYSRLAQIFERRDHTTILHLVQRFGNCCERYPEVAALYEKLREGGK